MKTRLDAILGRVTSYRLVTLSLAVLAAFTFAAAATGHLPYRPAALLATLITLLAVTILASLLFAALFGVSAHLESSVITALLLFFILQPNTDQTTLSQVALAGLFATASKYVLAVRRRHIFNPAAVGALWLSVFHIYLAFWWIGTPVLLPVTAVLALAVLYRTRRLPLAAVFLAVAAAILVGRNLSSGADLASAAKFALAQTPLVFFVGFMLSEPLTLPPARRQQLLVALVVAVLFAVPITIGSYTSGPETALLVGNAVAFCFGQRRAVELVLTARNRLSSSAFEFVFEPARALRFRPGQYLELAVPHRGADQRGTRRVFSIASAPTKPGSVKIGMNVPDRMSSFKRTLMELPVGATVGATGVSGDFTLPRNKSRPVVLIAGGIGVTPFISQLTALPAGEVRDVVLVYAPGAHGEIPYRDELQAAGVRTVVLAAAAPGIPLTPPLQHLTGQRLSAELLVNAVPDIARRHVFVSGPPAFVDAISGAVKQLHVRSVRKDYFNGY